MRSLVARVKDNESLNAPHAVGTQRKPIWEKRVRVRTRAPNNHDELGILELSGRAAARLRAVRHIVQPSPSRILAQRGCALR
jgi:hypothetical protein